MFFVCVCEVLLFREGFYFLIFYLMLNGKRLEKYKLGKFYVKESL